MFQEAIGFEDKVSVFQREAAAFESATLEFLDSLQPILRTPLPRVRVCAHVCGAVSPAVQITDVSAA